MQFKNYIANQDNLFPLSALISGAILLFVFIMTQILAYSSPEDTELLNKKMEIRELVKLKFAPQGDKLRKQSSNPAKAKISKNEQPELQPAKRTQVVAALMQGFDIKSHMVSGYAEKNQALPVTGESILISKPSVSNAICHLSSEFLWNNNSVPDEEVSHEFCCNSDSSCPDAQPEKPSITR